LCLIFAFLNFTPLLIAYALDKNRQFLDFEKPIKDLFEDIERLKTTAEKPKWTSPIPSASWKTR
jgi:hypothetical protein